MAEAPPAAHPTPGPCSGILVAAGRFLLQRPRLFALGLPFAWMAGIWWLSSRTFETGEVGFFVALLSNLMHAPLYGLLALLWAAVLLRRPDGSWPRPTAVELAALVLLPTLYGMLDEWHQSLVPGRDASFLDLLTDGTAAAATAWIITYLGAPGASERGLLGRLALGIVLCIAVAALGVL